MFWYQNVPIPKCSDTEISKNEKYFLSGVKNLTNMMTIMIGLNKTEKTFSL